MARGLGAGGPADITRRDRHRLSNPKCDAGNFAIAFRVHSAPVEDWVKQKKRYKLRVIEWLIFDESVKLLLLAIPRNEVLQMYFDKNEDYIDLVITAWCNSRHKMRHPWLNMINQPEPVDSREVPAVQVADMVAWATNCHLTRRSNGAWLYPKIMAHLDVSPREFSIIGLRRKYAEHLIPLVAG